MFGFRSGEWVLAAVLGLAFMVSVAAAQTTNLEAPGNLAPSVDPGCIAAADAGAELSPPDLGLGVVACGKAGEWDRAVEMFVLMQLKAVYDTRRVADGSAHQAGQVLAMQVTEALPEGGQAAMGEAFGSFGDTGGAGHTAFCGAVQAAGTPQHDPAWMVSHGMAAFTGIEGDGLVPGFDAEAAWAEVLTGYMKCSG